MTQGGLLHMSHPIFMDLNPICCYVSPKIVTFHEPIIIGTRNKCHWIQQAANPKYAPFKQLQCIFPSQIQQNVKFWFEIGFYLGTAYCTETQNLWHWIWHANPYICATQAISMHCSQSKSKKCEMLAISWTPPDKKLKKPSIFTGTECSQRLANLHI